MIAKGIQCFGRVQGVFFRASTVDKALELGVNGWVKNEHDGSVLIHAEGAEQPVKNLQEWCKSGPVHARVSEVKVWDKEVKGYSSFEIIR